jgi:hypothetical protein
MIQAHLEQISNVAVVKGIVKHGALSSVFDQR